MTDSCKYDYLFDLNDQEVFEVLYDIGTAREDFRYLIRQKYSRAETVLTFFSQAHLLQEDGRALSKSGKELFEQAFVFKNAKVAKDLFTQILLQNPVVNLIGQSFYGRGKVSIEQLVSLLNYHQVGSQQIVQARVIALLILLNKFGIVIYDKRNKVFQVRKVGSFTEPIAQYYITPDTPFSNIYNMRKAIRSCKGDIYWIDKHFRKEGFELLIDGLSYEGVKSITIISGSDNLTQSAKTDYVNLKSELYQRGILLTWRCINSNTFKLHDRWLVADNQCYNIPPILSIIRGQRAEILLTKEHLDVQPFMAESTSIS